MHRIKIITDTGTSELIIGGSAGDLRSFLPDRKVFVITDHNVKNLYSGFFPNSDVLSIIPGEQSKTLTVIEDLCRKLLDAGADRSSFILGFGGGVVCDIAGMVASLYMRGIKHGFVSTTLLSQVDASIGGKYGVDLGIYKNIIGSFKQPEFVICDQSMLSTLPDDEYLSGAGELIKHAVIRDRDLFFTISGNLKLFLDRDQAFLEDIIYRSVKVKAGIVKRDPHEKNIRMLLNFGHTFGHPIETTSGLQHGIAVMKGMIIAAELSVWTQEMPLMESRLLIQLLSQLGVTDKVYLPDNIADMISRDKKSEAGYMNTVLLRSIGKAVIRKIPLSELEAFILNRHGNRS